MRYAPIALFVYNRARHLKQTVDALRDNYLVKDSALFIFSDGPKDKAGEVKVAKVREYIKTIAGFKKVNIIERSSNLGLSKSIIKGVSEVVNEYGKVIVLEDDLVTSPYFLQFMNDALFEYKNEEKVISICAYNYPILKKRADNIFFRVTDSWGWGTWKRGWDLFVSDGAELYAALAARNLFKKLNLDGAFNFKKMLKRQIQRKNDSWAIRWYAAALLNGKLSLYPRQSLVKNIGQDGSGRHGGIAGCFKDELLGERVIFRKIPISEDEIVIDEIKYFFRKQRFNIAKRVLDFLKRISDNGFKA